MLYSTSTQYAIRGLSQLALLANGKSMMLEQLAEGTGLPKDFLSKVFQQLVKAGILKSIKGRGGGFLLAKLPHEISLAHIIEATDRPNFCNRCVVGLDPCNDSMPCPEHDLFKPIRQRLNDYLRTTTLADLVASLKTKPGCNAHPAAPEAQS